MAWPICKFCAGTGLNPQCAEDACRECGGRGFILPRNEAQRAADQEQDREIDD